MDSSTSLEKDDRLTVISIAALASILQDVFHEGLGHGVAAWLSGAHRITISTVAMQSDMDTRWISANGTIVNLIFAVLFWLILVRSQRCRPAARFFLVVALMGNLFTGTGYFLFSGVFDFGDWEAVIHGLEPHWVWRSSLVVIGAVAYFASMLLVAALLRPFRGSDPSPRRIRSLCWTTYFADGILAGIAGLLNPAGIFYVFASALPSTLGANAGLFSLPGMLKNPRPAAEKSVELIPRSIPWIAVSALAVLLYIFVVGRGLTWTR